MMMNKCKKFISRCRWGILAFVLAFLLGITFFTLTLQRYQVYVQLKNIFLLVQDNLNRAGFDFAYENLQFDAVYPKAFLSADDFQIYKKDDNSRSAWKIDHLEIRAGLFSPLSFHLDLSAPQKLVYSDRQFEIYPKNAKAIINFSDEGFDSFTLEAGNLNIKDIADIQEIRWGVIKTSPRRINNEAPFLDSHFRVNGIKLNGMLDYPLGQDISRIYLNSVVMGKIPSQPDFFQALTLWLEAGGFVDIKRLIINWAPLVFVARGDVYFNENLQPSIHLSSSSKGLLELLSQLQQKNAIDGKGAFVAKILLENKAFRLREDDKYSSVLTTIDWRDGKIAVENITVKKP